MLLDGIDVSNLNGDPVSYVNHWYYQQATFVIDQAIPRGPTTTDYRLHFHENQGKKLGIYTWLWHDATWRLDPNVQLDQRKRLATIPDDIRLDMRLWLDAEDNQSEYMQYLIARPAELAAARPALIDEVNAALETLDEWTHQNGGATPGVYTSRYFIDLLYGGWTPPNRQLWLADYGPNPHPNPGSIIQNPNYPYGENCVAHQYSSKPVDLDKMLATEIIPWDQPDYPEEDMDCQAYKEAIERAVNRIQIEMDRKTAAGKSAALRKTIFKEISGELFNALQQ